MRVPLSWLRDYVTVPPLPKLLERLTIAGFPSRAVETFPTSVVVGSIARIDPHPNADRLRVTSIDIGDGCVRQIVCGAKNIRKGQKVPVALPGTTLPNGVTIAEAEIRGVASAGMLCSEIELGLGNDHSGIAILPARAVVGTPASRILAGTRKDAVIELEVTPNRPDMLSIRGVAREVAALFGTAFRESAKHGTVHHGSVGIAVTVTARKDCALYAVCRIDGVAVGPSSQAVQERLAAAGLRSVNSIVDLTNLVMFETGQPLHAFDAAKVGDSLTVRRAAKGETLKALDVQAYELNEEDLVIAGGQGPLVIAGIMGGKGSGVSEKTTSLLLEAAVFSPALVRATSRRLGLVSESSQRFAKGIDGTATLAVLAGAAARIVKTTGGTVVGASHVGTIAAKKTVVRCGLLALEKLIGVAIPAARARKDLAQFGMAVAGTGNTLLVTPPSWRPDIRIPEDVAEELARLIGYDRLPKTLPNALLTPAAFPDAYAVREMVRDALVEGGANDCYTHAFYGEKHAAAVGLPLEQHVRLINPVSDEQSLLRMSALPLLLTAAAKEARTRDDVVLFEIGKSFSAAKSALPKERTLLSVVVVGDEAYRRAKGLLFHAANRLRMAKRFATSARGSSWGTGEDVSVDGSSVGTLALLAPERCAAFKFQRTTAILEIDLGLWTLPKPARFYLPSPYPTVKRDLAFWVDESVQYATIERVVSRHRPVLRSVELFDVFAKGGKVSYALHLMFGSTTKTLTAEEADAELARMAQDLIHHCAADIRS